MRFNLDKGNNSEYIELDPDGKGNLDLSIRTSASDRRAILITAKLNPDVLDKLIANLILLKSKISNE